jgi:ribosomal protein S18 acetylase RimI-like enzyme
MCCAASPCSNSRLSLENHESTNLQDSDRETICEIYKLSKPDEMKGSVDLRAFRPLETDGDQQTLFYESRILVTEDDGKVVGFGGNRGNYVSWPFVHPAHRRRGIAMTLMQQILAPLSGTVILNVGKNNLGARALYERLGFTVHDEFAGKWNGYDCQVARLCFELPA